MRTMRFLLLAFLLLPAWVHAGNVSYDHTFSTASADGPITTRATGVYNHRLTWTGAGTRTTCTIKLEQSASGTGSWSDLISAQNCATDGTATATGYANFIRINVTVLTGAGNTVYAIYDGTVIAPSLGTLTVDTTGLATSALQGGGLPATLGAGGGLKVDGSGTALPVGGTVNAQPVSQGKSTAYDSTLTGLGNSVAALTATTTVVQVLYCNNSDTAAHTMTVTDTAGTNYVGPNFSIPALSNVIFWESPVGLKLVGIKWGADTANKVYCQISGLQ